MLPKEEDVALDENLNGGYIIYDYGTSRYNNYTDWIISSRIPNRGAYGKFIGNEN